MAQGGRDRRTERLRVEYARWLLTDRVTRESNGLPTSHAAWAKAKEVSDRTLRRWRNPEVDPEFAELLAEEEARAAARLPGGTIRRRDLGDDPADEIAEVEGARTAGVTDPERLTYLGVKAALVEKAMNADREALGQYMKYWGHEFVAEEKEQRDRGFDHLSDDELVAEVEALIGVLRAG